MQSLIYATNSKLDFSHAVTIAYFFFFFCRRTIHYEAEDQFISIFCEYMRGISVYKTAGGNKMGIIWALKCADSERIALAYFKYDWRIKYAVFIRHRPESFTEIVLWLN